MKKRYICLGVIVVFLVFSGALGLFFSSNHSDSDSDSDSTTFSNYIVQGKVVSNESSITLTDYSEGTEDTFVADSESDQYYYGHWKEGEDPEAQYDVDLNVNLSDVKWNTTDFNESVIMDYLKHNVTSSNDSEWGFSANVGDSFSSRGNLSDVTFEGDMLRYSFNESSWDFIDGNYNESCVITISHPSTGFSFEIYVLIPHENINSYDPIDRTYTHYNIEKTY